MYDDLCLTIERAGEHQFEPGLYDGLPILVCVFCCRRKDGKLWHDGWARKLPKLSEDVGYFACPCRVAASPEGHGSHFIGCGGYGTVSHNHPARTIRYLSDGRRKIVEEYALTGDPSDGYICQTCQGTGIVRWQL